MKADRQRYRVIKTLAPSDRGAIEWARHYGESLVCVRHRTDAKGKVRHTTVELVVQSAPIRPRPAKLVLIRVEPHETDVHNMIKTAGGTWDSKQRLWRLPSRVASILRLRDRVVGA